MFNFGLFGSGAAASNVCVVIGNSGDWYGAERATTTTWVYGSINPLNAVSGQLSFALKWNVDGTIVSRLGNLGDEQMPDVSLAVLRYPGFTIALNWDATNGYYSAVDSVLTDKLIADHNIGERACFDITPVPDLFISYNFELMRGSIV